MLFFWNFYSTKNAEQNKKYHSFHKNVNQHNCLQNW